MGFQTTRLYLVVKKCNGGMFQSPPSMNAEVELESNYYTDHENLAKKLFVHITLAKNPRGITGSHLSPFVCYCLETEGKGCFQDSTD